MVVEVQGVPPKLPYATLIHFLEMGVAGWGVTPRPKDKYFVGATSTLRPHKNIGLRNPSSSLKPHYISET